MPAGTLQVQLVGATDLKHVNLLGKLFFCFPGSCVKAGNSDPYVVLKCQGQSFQSDIAKGQGSSPTWDQSFTFQLSGDDQDNDDTKQMFIKVFDKDELLGSDDFIGTVRVPLAGVIANHRQEPTSYNVVLPAGKPKGRITLSMTFHPKV